MIKIISAFYDSLDVAEILNKKIINDQLYVIVCNEIFTDPNNGVVKKLIVKYEYNGEVFDSMTREGNAFQIPIIQRDINHNNILLMTSCNRIKQVILSLTINSFIIKDRFSVVISDCSTPKLSAKEAILAHHTEPYNVVTEKGFCSDIELFEFYMKDIKNIYKYRILHQKPILNKQVGEASLIISGLQQAALMGDDKHILDNCVLKLTGICILRKNIFDEIRESKKTVFVYNRTVNAHIRSTRIFGCKPKEFLNILLDEGYDGWIKEYAICEEKLTEICERNDDSVYYTNQNETGVLLDDGYGMISPENMRNRILEIIEKNGIPKDLPIIDEFIRGEIW